MMAIPNLSSFFLPSKSPCFHSLPSPPPLPLWSPLVASTTSPSPSPLSATASDISASAIAYPALACSTTLHFKSAYNVQITVGDDEPEDKILKRFRREVLKAGVLQECRRRRFFENKQDKKKRKAREASRRNRKRRPQSRAPAQNKHEGPKKKMDDEEDDNWELPDVDPPYC